eukprot:117730_1
MRPHQSNDYISDNKKISVNRKDRTILLTTCVPDQFTSTQKILSYLSQHKIITKFDINKVEINPNGQIIIEFITKFTAKLFLLKLKQNQTVSKLFTSISPFYMHFNSNQYCMLNLCVEKRSRNANNFNNIINRWKGECIIECNAQKRQFYIYCFKDPTHKSYNNNKQYIKIQISHRIIQQTYIINNNNSYGIELLINEPPKCWVFGDHMSCDIDEEKKQNNNNNNTLCPKEWFYGLGKCNFNNCSFKHLNDINDNELGNNELFWSTNINDKAW